MAQTDPNAARAEQDRIYMRQAIALAHEGLGATAENPSVGCVLVADGEVVGQARTADGGRPHAETQALAQAGPRARGATAYVTLEPCSHLGQTPPCSQALLDAGIARLVVACQDPDARVAGRGLRALEAAGIEVECGCLSEEAQRDLAGYLCRQKRGRPLVTLKVAASLDGKIALANGASQWITGPEAREQGHRLRAQSNLIITGSGTILADDAKLTCRLAGLEARSPRRLVLDRRARVPKSASVFDDQDLAETLHLVGAEAEDLTALMQALGGQGHNAALLEAGPGLATAFLECGLVDRLAWFVAPKIMGGDARSALGALGLETMQAVQAWDVLEERRLGQDWFFLLQRPASS